MSKKTYASAVAIHKRQPLPQFTQHEYNAAITITKTLFTELSETECKRFLMEPSYVFNSDVFVRASKLWQEYKHFYVDPEIDEYHFTSHKPQVDMLLRWLWTRCRDLDMISDVGPDNGFIRSWMCLMHAFARNGMQGYRLQRAFVTSAARVPHMCVALLHLSHYPKVFNPPLDVHAPFQNVTALYLAVQLWNTPLIRLLMNTENRSFTLSIALNCRLSKPSYATRHSLGPNTNLRRQYVLHEKKDSKSIHPLNRLCCYQYGRNSTLPKIHPCFGNDTSDFHSVFELVLSRRSPHASELFLFLNTCDDNANLEDMNGTSLDREFVEWRSDYDHENHLPDDDEYWYTDHVKRPFVSTHRRQLLENFFCGEFDDQSGTLIMRQKITEALNSIRARAIEERKQTYMCIISIVAQNIVPLAQLTYDYIFHRLPHVTLGCSETVSYKHEFVPANNTQNNQNPNTEKNKAHN